MFLFFFFGLSSLSYCRLICLLFFGSRRDFCVFFLPKLVVFFFLRFHFGGAFCGFSTMGRLPCDLGPLRPPSSSRLNPPMVIQAGKTVHFIRFLRGLVPRLISIPHDLPFLSQEFSDLISPRTLRLLFLFFIQTG